MKSYPIVHVKANDWNLYDGQYDSDYDFSFAPMEVCGFLVYEDMKKIVIALEYQTESDEFRSVVSIPRECITEMRFLPQEGKNIGGQDD